MCCNVGQHSSKLVCNLSYYNTQNGCCHHYHYILPTPCALCLAVLVRYGSGIEQNQVSMAGRTTQKQATKMTQLAGQALQAWKVGEHPGWSVDSMDSHYLPAGPAAGICPSEPAGCLSVTPSVPYVQLIV